MSMSTRSGDAGSANPAIVSAPSRAGMPERPRVPATQSCPETSPELGRNDPFEALSICAKRA
jgi:hypothetical protein